MVLIEHCPLKDKHTFHLDVSCRYWAEASNEQELTFILTDRRFEGIPSLLVGAGSNLLFTADYKGLLLHVAFQGIERIYEDEDRVEVRVGAGVVWDDLVAWSVEQNLWGLENLSGIPGCVGASPVQNIGAYGSEARDLIREVDVFDRNTHETETLNNEACRFSYRDSAFKHEYKDRYIVCRVVYSLSKKPAPNLGYGDLEKHVHELGTVTPATIRNSVLSIRNRKLPDPESTGNAGSFFTNPIIPAEQYHQLRQAHPDIPGWHIGSDKVKIPAAWCIEQTGWKGRHVGGARVHHLQPLVLINTGTATPADIMQLAASIRADVLSTFGIILKPEVLYV